jgi:hypothetical protein
MAAAIPLLMAGAATSQSTVANDQTQTGAVDSEQTLNVEVVTDQTTAATTAVGNSLSGAVQSGSVDVESAQSLQGPVTANAVLNATTDISQAAALTTTATGNAGEADALGGGSLTGNFAQDAQSVLVRANDQIEGATAEGGDAATAASATANTQGLGTDAGSINASVTQTSSATVEADGGAILKYSPGTTTFSATAISNNVTSTGTDGSTQAVNVSQTMTGDHTQATKFVAFGNGQEVDTTASASSNNVSASNDGAELDVTTFQDNEGYVRAQAETTAYEFGSASSTATGVGNSAIARENGASLTLANTQMNGGAGVEAVASTGGNTGYDLAATASASGNAVTGYACTLCGGRMSVSNSQSNSADIGARTTINVDGSARSVTGVATAVGNSATFYVSKPGG